jgi:hypothetical protein
MSVVEFLEINPIDTLYDQNTTYTLICQSNPLKLITVLPDLVSVCPTFSISL